MILRTLTTTLLLLALSLSAKSQIVHRAEFAPYALRKEATAKEHTTANTKIDFAPTASASAGGQTLYEQLLEVPQSWVDASIYIHLEATGSAYTLEVNGSVVTTCFDSFAPTTYDISKYLRVGKNVVSLITHSSRLSALEEGLAAPSRPLFEGSYIFAQNKLRILDYTWHLEEHEDGLGGQLFIEVIVENKFNFDETIEVGFDVYDPSGNLLDFSSLPLELVGNSIDTIRFAPHLYGAAKNRWNPDTAVGMQRIGQPTTRYTDQLLYSLMLFTKRNRISSDYIPFSVGYFLPQYQDDKLFVGGNEVMLRSTTYNALGSEEQSEKELRALKAQGFNTIAPSYPQPLWFYSLCDKIGLYVIDQAAINAPTASDDKSVGGTPSNDPALCDEYIERVKKMYYRSRNFSCVIAFSLGSPSGNGYNMYKAYEWLKSVETRRPVIYSGAAGEWNSDLLKVE